jgi:putative peptidoglycan lipid II flippase
MAPAILGSSVAQINLLLDTIIGSFLTVGCLSWLYYSDRLMEFPLGLLGVTLGTIILPRLSREHVSNSPAQFRATIDWAIRLILVLGIPAAIGLMILAKPMLMTLFGYGKFLEHDATMASYSLIAYGSGLPAFLLIKIFAPAFFARQNTKTPVRIGIIALISNMVYNLLFVLPMIWLDFIAPHTGLALESSLAAWQQALMLYRQLGREEIYKASKPLVQFATRLLPALAILCLTLWWLTGADWNALSASQRVTRLLGIIGAGALAYFIGLAVTGFRPKQLSSP